VAHLADLHRCWLVFASDRVNADVYQDLLRQHVVVGTKGCILIENTSFGGFSASLHYKNHSVAVSRILISRRLATIFAVLEFVDFAIWCFLQAKVLAMPHSNLAALHPSIAMEWDWLAAVHIPKTCCFFHHRR
jgi:hypothetical protein